MLVSGVVVCFHMGHGVDVFLLVDFRSLHQWIPAPAHTHTVKHVFCGDAHGFSGEKILWWMVIFYVFIWTMVSIFLCTVC